MNKYSVPIKCRIDKTYQTGGNAASSGTTDFLWRQAQLFKASCKFCPDITTYRWKCSFDNIVKSVIKF